MLTSTASDVADDHSELMDDQRSPAMHNDKTGSSCPVDCQSRARKLSMDELCHLNLVRREQEDNDDPGSEIFLCEFCGTTILPSETRSFPRGLLTSRMTGLTHLRPLEDLRHLEIGAMLLVSVLLTGALCLFFFLPLLNPMGIQ